ncbi:MAG: hypothetical protein ACP5HU_02430 [Phycisphaerae bacterium]
MRFSSTVLLVIMAVLTAFHPACAQVNEQAVSPERRLLPDYSEGLMGVMGPFLWTRSIDLGGDVRWCDSEGRPDADGEFLWLYQYMAYNRSQPEMPLIHERNNLVSMHEDIAYELQPWQLLLHCRRPHNFKFVMGYTDEDTHFEHGDNTDLAHLATGDRVVLFVPIRHDTWEDSSPATDQSEYYVNPQRGAQGPCVIEFKAGEIIRYEWFGGEELDEHILLDLTDVLGGRENGLPLVQKSIYRFELGEEKGQWRLMIKLDGRDGEPESEDEWDLVFTQDSPGAKPYTVDITRENSVWAMNTFSPGGLPEDSSEAVIKLLPFDRDTGERVDWPGERRRVRTFAVDKLDEVLQGGNPKQQRPAERLRRLGRD